jgi:hypothetical protein
MAESVPYANALRPGAPYKGEEALKDIESVLREFKPTKIFVSHPEDSHPDHRALYLFTRIALWDMASELRPQLYPYLVHFTNWPQPRGYHPDESSEPPTALGDRIPWQIYRLTREEIGRKEGALKAHRTQYESSTAYLSEFVRRNELFGDFPSLTLSPHIPSLTVSPNRQAELLETQEELTARERAAFVGIEERYVQLKNGSFVLSIKFSRSLGEEVGISALIFGYRADVPFARMPKLHIKVGLTGHKVYDQNRSLSPKSIRVVRETRRITLQVPLKILGYPERVLTSTHSFLANVPLDRVSWRAVELSSGK